MVLILSMLRDYFPVAIFLFCDQNNDGDEWECIKIKITVNNTVISTAAALSGMVPYILHHICFSC